jgi:hypothetical protein
VVGSINLNIYNFHIIGEHCYITTTADEIPNEIFNATDPFNIESDEECFGFE